MAGWHFAALPSRQLSQMGDVDNNPVHMTAEEEFWTIFKVSFLWGRSSGSSGEHPKGLALDFSILAYGGGVSNPGPANYTAGNKIANWLWANRGRLGVWYVIWNRKIISTNRSSYAYGRWVDYRGSNPHTDHVHVSFYSANIYQPPATIPTPKPVEPEDELTPEDKRWIAERFDEAVTDAVNQAKADNASQLEQAVAKNAATVQATEERLRSEIRGRSTGRIKQEDADTLGYGGKTVWQDSFFSADASVQIRRLRRDVLEQFGQSDRLQRELHPPDEDVPPADPAEPTPASDEAQS